ncbi:peptidoglycan recognition protein family protein [Pseudomonas sp. ZT5P21]
MTSIGPSAATSDTVAGRQSQSGRTLIWQNLPPASSVKLFNTGVIGIVLLENLTTAEEGGDIVAKGREALEFVGYSTTNVIPAAQIDALLHLVEALKSVFVIERFGGHREFPGQDRDGKICPGNIGMELVRNIRTKTQLLPPPKPAAE